MFYIYVSAISLTWCEGIQCRIRRLVRGYFNSPGERLSSYSVMASYRALEG